MHFLYSYKRKKYKHKFQFVDFDVDMSEWEVHTASELPATVQAELLINRMEFHRSVYDTNECNLIMNHVYKLNDMYKTPSLAHSIAEQKDDSALLWETIRVAQEEVDALPDGMVGLSQMHKYGYSWDEMLPLTKDRASELFEEFTEGMSLEDIYTKFNIDHPAGFTGHSLSVSDVVVLYQDGENTSHYVDSVGYREIPEFTKELSVSAEINTEKDAVREETAV